MMLEQANDPNRPTIPRFKFIFATMIIAPIFYLTFYITAFIMPALVIYNHFDCSTEGVIGFIPKFMIALTFVAWNFFTYLRSDNDTFTDIGTPPTSCIERVMRNKKARGFFLILISLTNLTDTYLDITFIVLAYIARLIWVVVPLTICYILIFAEKFYCIKSITKLAYQQWKLRRIANLMKRPKMKFLFYSACISLDLHCIAESMVSTKIIVHQFKGLLIFSLIMNVIQKTMFICMKFAIISMSDTCSNPVIAMSIPINILSIFFIIVFFKYK